MVSLSIISIILFLKVIYINCKDIKPKLINTTLFITQNSYRLTMEVGHPKGKWNRAIDQENQFTWIYHQLHNETLSPSARKLDPIKEGIIYEDQFSFFTNQSVILPNFSYVVVHNTSAMRFLHLGCFGLAYKFFNESLSLIHHLYKHDYIDHLAYSFIMGENDQAHQIYFGGIPNNISLNKKSGKCKVDTSQFKWSCRLSKVTFGSFTFYNTYSFYFQVADEPIYAPHPFIERLLTQVFNKKIADGICKIVTLEKRDTIKCLTKEILTFPMFNFTIDFYVYSFQASEFFEYGKEYSYLNLIKNPYSNSSWIIGTSFVKHFDALFDYEGSFVQLFSNTRIEEIKIDTIIIWYINSALMLIGIIFLVIWKVFYSKKMIVEFDI